MTTGPPRYFIGIFGGDPDDPLTWIGGPRAFVERTKEQAEARPVVWIEDLEKSSEEVRRC